MARHRSDLDIHQLFDVELLEFADAGSIVRLNQRCSAADKMSDADEPIPSDQFPPRFSIL